MVKRLSGNKGFTLAELIVTLALMGIILLPASSVLITGFKSSEIEGDTLIAQGRARELMNMILTDLRKSSNSVTSITDGGGTLIIKGSENDPAAVTYRYLDGVLYKRKSAEAEEAPVFENSPDVGIRAVKSFTVSYSENNRIIDIDFTLQVGKGREIRLQSSFRRKIAG